MKTFVLNLKRRPDRLEYFNKKNKIEYERFDAIDGKNINHTWLKENWFDTNKDWIDPFNKTHLTRGEIGCFLSHYKLWLKCMELQEPIVVLEDDAILTDNFSYQEIDEVFSKGYNFLYLGWLEMKNLDQRIDDKFVIPNYPYWTLAYALTPEAASVLVTNHIRKNIIPVDEYLPLMMEYLHPCAYADNVVYPRGKGESVTDVDPLNRYDFFIDFKTYAITVGSDDSKCKKLYDSSLKNNFEFINIGKDSEWKGSDMSGPGGGQKINLLKNYIEDLEDHDVIFFADGYDVFVANSLEEIVYRYLEQKCKVLFAAESVCWPDESISNQFPETYTPYRYLNSGLLIGRVDELKRIISDSIEDYEDDQLFYQKKFLSGNYDIKLDYESYIFQCHDQNVQELDERLYNPVTNCYTCVYHGNGNSDAKEFFNKIYNKIYKYDPIVYIPTHKYDILHDDMLMVDFMTQSMCEDLIEIADSDGEWESLSYDKFPAREIRMKKLNLWDSLEHHWEKYLCPLICDYWRPIEMYGMRDAFVMRYSLNTQTNLNLHTDASLITGTVKLNDDYDGAELFFPRQNISNKDIPVGKCILFPGQVTHGHECTELKSGIKYSLTMWTNRYIGDSI